MHVLARLTFFSFVLLFSTLSAYAYSSPPSGAITIGSKGTYSTFAAALKDTSSTTYFVYAGTYNEQVYITRSNIKIYGQTSSSNSYTGNTVTITYGLSINSAGSDDLSGTFRVHGSNVALYNLNIANSYGKGAQAITLSVYGSEFGGYGLKLTGYQDTYLAESGYQYLANSYISGATDFIFGQKASLWIENSQINTLANGYITASGRDSDDSSWYVINNSIVGGSGTTYLGRPWREYARVVFQKSYLHSNVASAGWSQWSSSTPNINHVTFAEYDNSGTGATGTRASFSEKLSSAVTMKTVLGSSQPSWIDSSFLPA